MTTHENTALKNLLIITAIFEGTTGLAFVVAPELVVSLLLDGSLMEPAGILVGTLAGVALLSLSFICWLYRNNGAQASGVVKGLIFYNVAAAVLLVAAWVNGFSGPGIWPASLLHTGLTVWCVKSLLK